jgi:hypothetical protein
MKVSPSATAAAGSQEDDGEGKREAAARALMLDAALCFISINEVALG